mmetsp:Transcript_9937/g.25134  ORF Transcript_9937/g.25134 Transcript_9937/m.25134 type:complete len:161 (+) Transcript_9937:88-570(+)
MGIELLLLVNRQGKVRLTKFYADVDKKDKQRVVREVSSMVLGRTHKLCNFIEWRGKKIVYKRYASLYFVTLIDAEDNELITLETIHHYVENLDKYFGNVAELDIIFNFHKAYYILDELLIGGELQETSKRNVLKAAGAQDDMMEEDLKRDTPLNRIKLKV